MKNITIDGRKIVVMTCIGIVLVFFAFVLFWGARWLYNYSNSPTSDVTQSCCQIDNQDCFCKCRVHPTAVITPKPKPKPTPVPQPKPTPQIPIGPPPFSDPTPIYTPAPAPLPQSQPQPNPSYIGPPPYSNPTTQTGTTYGSGYTGGVPFSDNGGSTSGIGPQPYPSY